MKEQKRRKKEWKKDKTQIHFAIHFLLIDFSSCFSHTQKRTMSQDDTKETQGAANMEEPAAQRDIEANREMAERLLEGDGVDKDEEKAVSLLEDCMAHGDADAMLMLAKCCALGRGMKYNAKRAEALMSDAAKKGNNEARFLMKLINDWKGEESVDLESL